jgi:hypothetical protein
MRYTILAAVALLVPLSGAGAQTAARRPALAPALDSARMALDRYADPIHAVYDGYLSTVVCMDFSTPLHEGEMQYPAGGMGVHFLNLGLIGQPLDPARPQVLIYEPDGNNLRLVAAEWFVPVAAAKERPQLFGRPFDGPMEGHAPIMPDALHHWDLHVWLWKDNPAGTFVSTNPTVRCPSGSTLSHHSAPPKIVTPN